MNLGQIRFSEIIGKAGKRVELVLGQRRIGPVVHRRADLDQIVQQQQFGLPLLDLRSG